MIPRSSTFNMLTHRYHDMLLHLWGGFFMNSFFTINQFFFKKLYSTHIFSATGYNILLSTSLETKS